MIKTGKEHSLECDETEFNKYLRLNFYNVKLSNSDVYEIKKMWNINNNKNK